MPRGRPGRDLRTARGQPEKSAVRMAIQMREARGYEAKPSSVSWTKIKVCVQQPAYARHKPRV
jgi:hypothetical protein